MASKTTLETLINTNLASGGAILAKDHREVEEALVDEFFPTVDTYTGTTAEGVFYQFDFAKVGNIVSLNIRIRNTNPTSVGVQFLNYASLGIPTKYLPLYFPYGQMYRIGTNGITYQIGITSFSILETLPPSTTNYLSTITYISNND